MLNCNDRRWPEAWRVVGLQGVELVCSATTPPPTTPTAATPRIGAAHLPFQTGRPGQRLHERDLGRGGRQGRRRGRLRPDRRLLHRRPEQPLVAEAASLGDEVLVADCDLDLAARARRRCSTSPPTAARPVWPDHRARRRCRAALTGLPPLPRVKGRRQRARQRSGSSASAAPDCPVASRARSRCGTGRGAATPAAPVRRNRRGRREQRRADVEAVGAPASNHSSIWSTMRRRCRSRRGAEPAGDLCKAGGWSVVARGQRHQALGMLRTCGIGRLRHRAVEVVAGQVADVRKARQTQRIDQLLQRVDLACASARCGRRRAGRA